MHFLDRVQSRWFLINFVVTGRTTMTRHTRTKIEWKAELAFQKTLRDASELKRKARYVLILGDDAHTLEFIDNSDSADFCANIFAVLAPADVYGNTVPEALIFEMGISETRPYNDTFKRKGGNGNRLYARRKARDPNEQEIRTIWKELSSIIPWLVEELRRKWKSQGGWCIEDRATGEVHISGRGRRFSASTGDGWILERILELEWRYLKRKYLGEYIRWTEKYLRKYKLSWRPCYGKKVQKNGEVKLGKIPERSTGLHKTIGYIGGIRFPNPFVTWRFFSSLGKREALVRNALDVVGKTYVEERYRILSTLKNIPEYSLRTIGFTKGSPFVVFEIFPNEVTRDAEPRRESGNPDHKIDPPFDDIPFTPEELAEYAARNRKVSDPDHIPF